MTKRTLLLILLSMAAQGCTTPPPEDSQRTAATTALSARLGAMAENAPIVVAHRGASSTHPENTLVAFRAASEAGAGMIEFDVRQASDGSLVCIHDETIDRTTDGPRRFGRDRVAVRSLTTGQLQELDAGRFKGEEHAGATIPTLREALQTILTGSVPMIEHKDGDPERYVELLREMDLVGDVLVQSFDWEWLAKVRRLEPGLTLGALGEDALTDDRLRAIEALGVAMVHWNHQDLGVDDVRRLHDRGYLVCVYTANSDFELIGCARAGLDAVTTNVPARLAELERRGLARR